MKILYLALQLPYPPISGGRIKTLSTLRSLINLGHEVVFFSFFENKQEMQNIKFLKRLGVKQVITCYNKEVGERSNKKRVLRLIKSLFSIKPFGVLRYYDRQMAEKINVYLRNNKVDIFWAHMIFMAQYLPVNFREEKILESIDVESRLFKMAFFVNRSFSSKLFLFYEWLKFAVYEKFIYKKFDIIFSISQNDKISLQRITNKNITVLPPSIDINRMRPANIKTGALLFIGTLFWYPNRDGMEWFLEKIYPELQKEIPSVNLRIIGKFYPGFQPKEEKGIKIGVQKDLSDFIQQSEIFIVPIRYGTGIRIKILDAMSWGLPVISTYEGAHGLDVTDGKELLLVKNEEEFVQKIMLLLNNKKLQNKLIKNSVKFLQENYSNKKNEHILKHIIEVIENQKTKEKARNAQKIAKNWPTIEEMAKTYEKVYSDLL